MRIAIALVTTLCYCCLACTTESFALNNTIQRQPLYFTQGLFFDSPTTLIESSGLYGESFIHRLNALTGNSLQSQNLSPSYFGEGCAMINDKIYQLTWKEGKCLVYDKSLNLIETKNLIPEMNEGWGATSDLNYLYFSDGTNKIYVIHPDLWTLARTIEVVTAKGTSQDLINALQYVNGYIYANIYMTNNIIKINAQTGQIVNTFNMNELYNINQATYSEGVNNPNNVLNGIAYNEETNHFYVTGKRWNYIFELTFPDELVCSFSQYYQLSGFMSMLLIMLVIIM